MTTEPTPTQHRCLVCLDEGWVFITDPRYPVGDPRRTEPRPCPALVDPTAHPRDEEQP